MPGNVSDLINVLVTQASDVISPCNSDVQASGEDMSSDIMRSHTIMEIKM